LLLRYYVAVCRIARGLWWTNQELSPVDIIPPRFSMLIYHLGDEQKARRWPEFRDVISPHRHYHYDDDDDDDDNNNNNNNFSKMFIVEILK
jgi:hypothetical protein